MLQGVSRQGAFGRSDEYLYFLQFGAMQAEPLPLPDEWNPVRTKNKLSLRWKNALRSGEGSRRADSPNLFYPVFVRNTEAGPVFESVGSPYFGTDRSEVEPPEGCVAVWPIRQNGEEGRWMNGTAALDELIANGYARLGRWNGAGTTIYYLARGERAKIENGTFPVLGHAPDGSVIVDDGEYTPSFLPTTQWNIISHDAGYGGARLLNQLLPGKQFPSPKSLYAVEDALRFFLASRPSAVVLDFFAGSGTTAHAVCRLNREDGGQRQAIVVTNNEVSAAEQHALRTAGFRPGDSEWEANGICDLITKPRLAAAILGSGQDGEPLEGDYRYNLLFPLAEGFEENAEFFTLTYESPVAVGHNKAFERIASLLWLRAGARGSRIDQVPAGGWAVVDAYGLLFDLDQAQPFCEAMAQRDAGMAFVVTDDDRRFQAVARRLPEGVEPVRLYESYLSNFRFASGE